MQGTGAWQPRIALKFRENLVNSCRISADCNKMILREIFIRVHAFNKKC
jgi:hypothetical protein